MGDWPPSRAVASCSLFSVATSEHISAFSTASVDMSRVALGWWRVRVRMI